MSHQGRLLDASGDPLTGFHTVTFSIHTAPSGAGAEWSETQTLDFTNGYYSATLGVSQSVVADDFDGGDLWLGIAVDGGAQLGDRLPMNTVPYAFRAQNADEATTVTTGAVLDVSEIKINGTTVIDSSGTTVDWGDITGIPTSVATGLPTCGSGQILTYGGSSWSCADSDDHTHNAADLDGGIIANARLPIGTEIAAASHTHPGVGVNDLSCADGEVAKWNSGAWECAAAGGGGGGALMFSYEVDGSAPFEDFSGGGHPLTTDGLGLAQGSAGHSATAVNFTGGLLTVASGNAIFASPAVTVDSWIRPAIPTDGDQTILEKEGSYLLIQKRGSDNQIGTVEFSVTTESGDVCSVESYLTVTAGAWAHVAGSYNGRTISVSVNDDWVEGTCDKGPLVQAAGSALNIGAASGKTNTYNGLIDEIRGWATALPTSFFLGASDAFPGSAIITPEEGRLINEWIGDRSQRWELCYKLTANGAATSTFHSRCNNRGPTVTVGALSTGRRIGGYAHVSWQSRNDYNYGDDHFIFSLDNDYKYGSGARHSNGSIYDHSTYGPTFGAGHDISFGYSSVIGNGGGDDYCNLGHSFQCRTGVYSSTSCRNEICGTYSGWSLTELETWVQLGN